MPVKLGFIILSLIGVLRIPEEFYLYKDKDKDKVKDLTLFVPPNKLFVPVVFTADDQNVKSLWMD